MAICPMARAPAFQLRLITVPFEVWSTCRTTMPGNSRCPGRVTFSELVHELGAADDQRNDERGSGPDRIIHPGLLLQPAGTRHDDLRIGAGQRMDSAST